MMFRPPRVSIGCFVARVKSGGSFPANPLRIRFAVARSPGGSMVDTSGRREPQRARYAIGHAGRSINARHFRKRSDSSRAKATTASVAAANSAASM